MMGCMKIYTRTGDDGTTGLIGGDRVRKSDKRLDCYGTVDELNATIGWAAIGGDAGLGELLRPVQEELFVIGSHLAHEWSLASGLAFLAWYVFAPQCASTLGVVKRETNSWRWPAIMFGYMIGLAYIAAFITYHVALALGAG